jgi:pilus assembly protein CpaB
LGATAREALEPGEPVLWSDVNDPLEAPPLSDAVPQGRRAVTLPLDPSSSFSGLLRPGDRVDLLCTREGGSGGVALLEAVPVLAVGKNVSSPAGDNAESDEPLTATLSLLPSQVVAVLGAARSGSVQWVLRNGDDEGRSPSGNRPPRLEIWEGGVLWDRHAGL